MRILLTNDDGIQSSGIRLLCEALSCEHEVWVCAPDGERSGTSSCITLQPSLFCKQWSEREYSCSGYPADCVSLALLGLLPEEPDLLLSGINRGANYGGDLIYSGTVGAARHAALQGLPAVALSLCTDEAPYFFSTAVEFICDHLGELCSLIEKGTFVNVNLPNRSNKNFELLCANPSFLRYVADLSKTELTKGLWECSFTTTLSPDSTANSDAYIVSQGNAAYSVFSTDCAHLLRSPHEK